MRILRFTALIFAVSSLAAQAHIDAYINAEMKVQMITSACAAFEATYGALPSQTNWFAELTASTNARINQKKIVFLNAKDNKDPWGGNIVGRIPGIHNLSGMDVYSLGKDGRSSSGGNDPDDINNWNPARPWCQQYSGMRLRVEGVALVSGGGLLALLLFRLPRRRKKTEQHASPNDGSAGTPPSSAR